MLLLLGLPASLLHNICECCSHMAQAEPLLTKFSAVNTWQSNDVCCQVSAKSNAALREFSMAVLCTAVICAATATQHLLFNATHCSRAQIWAVAVLVSRIKASQPTATHRYRRVCTNLKPTSRSQNSYTSQTGAPSASSPATACTDSLFCMAHACPYPDGAASARSVMQEAQTKQRIIAQQ